VSWARWVGAHQRSLLFLALTLVVGGVAAALTMPASLFPNVAFPRIRVSVNAGEQPARQMVLQATRPVEEAIRRVRDVRRVRSSTSRGGAEIDVDFSWGTDMRRALLETDAAINQVLPQLPPQTRVDARRMDPTVYPVIAYSLTSDSLSLTRLRNIAEYQLRPLLTALPGVADIGVQGGTIAEDQVDVDPAKLRALGLTLADVTRAVADAADLRGLGRLQDRYKLFLLLGNNQPNSLQALRQVMLRAGPKGAVRLSDVAEVHRSTRPQWIRVTADGHDAVLLQVFQQISANSVALAGQVRADLAKFEKSMPAGLHIANWYDQSRLVVAAASSVRDAILIGVLLAGLVLVAFLRNLRLVLVALAVVPAVLAITTLLLRVAGQSFNMMTLGGMAAAVGLVIDDVIVMLEHIVRRLHDRARPRPRNGSALPPGSSPGRSAAPAPPP
jgi:Cation/multidrug efflux pump